MASIHTVDGNDAVTERQSSRDGLPMSIVAFNDPFQDPVRTRRRTSSSQSYPISNRDAHRLSFKTALRVTCPEVLQFAPGDSWDGSSPPKKDASRSGFLKDIGLSERSSLEKRAKAAQTSVGDGPTDPQRFEIASTAVGINSWRKLWCSIDKPEHPEPEKHQTVFFVQEHDCQYIGVRPSGVYSNVEQKQSSESISESLASEQLADVPKNISSSPISKTLTWFTNKEDQRSTATGTSWFGKAPWHRKDSYDTISSATSSVRDFLAGKTPPVTPDPEGFLSRQQDSTLTPYPAGTWFHLGKTVTPGTLLNRPDLQALNETKRDATTISQKDPRSGFQKLYKSPILISLLFLLPIIMAANEQDPLLLLWQSIASKRPAVPTASADASATEVPLSQATHLLFSHPAPVSVSLSTPTRFISSDRPVDLRSIYFAWLNKDVAIPEYNASATRLNEELGSLGTVQNLAFVERLDLFTWLEGASEESEHIKPLAGDKDGKEGASASASKTAPATAASRAGRGTLDPRLAVIYNGERKMGDRNSVLRGVKHTDFSHVRKLAVPFIQKKPNGSSNISANPSLALNQKAPTRRPDPIILLSPSASSLLRLSNIRSFLESGRYVQPDGSAAASMLHVSRVMKDIDPSRPMRFILVEGPEQFKPEYWNRVVAVFTTGQSWQFKNYKWSSPPDLFRRILGIFIGWRGEQPPDSVKDWGHRVLQLGVDRWRDGTGAQEAAKFRDKEAAESIWRAIEANMKNKGWTKTTAPTQL
ncbi:Cdc73 family RNA pol II accessory factor [Colletotrichum lupini]|uniref:Cdc73 family RNA pol II accessory factor n=1 Tax=Colletotrichum lupini TaxID=145971 RepID=A0A9Q8T5L3_9PEZI|nr:Cdc73 family RNA pol II accessory factor [Colletotrichum lupini]UQC89577.1 Cdc73 family RNA pol II accessory factor [Colletotrichum lupini]